ncbi:response regulator [Acanthopleuribacter pedis]|uniref:Response regulator n=1 Tax=Acanthopleuribacter pedis TaxID=442870 RepID=A0A8J7QDX8_9BACT|nr:response regulator [Acanthopleuribacter pedis]MBO1317840.1 response regulator [Acanthopleuribacter pedis]
MSLNLLIVDDEAEIRNLLARHFTLLDYTVATAENGKAAVEILENSRIDAVITDILMPEMDGIGLLGYLRDQLPMVRTIVITGYITLDNALACMRLRAEAFVFKPIEDLTELEEAIGQIEKRLKTWQRKLRELRGMRPEA